MEERDRKMVDGVALRLQAAIQNVGREIACAMVACETIRQGGNEIRINHVLSTFVAVLKSEVRS